MSKCEKDIFNLDNVDDLPESVRKELSRGSSYTENIMMLFEEKQELNVDQILVGYFRKFGESKDRNSLVAKLHAMKKNKNGQIEVVKGRKGVYRKCKD